MFRRSWKKALATLALIGFVLLLLGPMLAKAAVSEAEYYQAAVLLGRYNMVQGDERGFRFTDDISRAELAKLLVVAVGLENEVPSYLGRRDFSDIQGHWAEGYIAVAKKAGLLRGYPEGDFRPRNPVSYAEIITVMSRLVGLEPSKEPWPRTYLTPAVNAGIVPDAMDSVQNLNGAAIRGDVFVLLKRTMVDVKNYAGETLLQRYHDRVPPKITIDPQPAETQSVKLTVTGTVKDGEQVRINGTLVKLDYGVFQYTADLRLGPNTIRVQALDLAGNVAEEVVRVNRVAGSAASIELTGPASVGAGQTGTYRVIVKDQNGEVLADRSQVEAAVSGSIGTFDVASGTFTAGAAAGQGTITLVAGSARASLNVTVTAGALNRIAITPAELSLAPGEKMTFTAAGFDAGGNPVPLTGVTWSASGGTIDANGQFTAGTATADVTVTARAGAKTATATVRPLNHKVAGVQVAAPARALTADRQDTLNLTVTVLDAAGQPVTDYQGTLIISSSAAAVVSPVQTTVQVSGGVATVPLRAGATAGTATVSVTTNLGKTGTAAVTVAPQQLQMVRISAQTAPLTANPQQHATIEAVALDTNGRPMVAPLNQSLFVNITPTSDMTPPATITFESNGQTSADIVLGPLDPTTGDVRTRMTVLYTAGSGTFTLGGTARPATLSYVQILPGALVTGPALANHDLLIEPVPNTVAGETRSIYVLVRDPATGRPITDGNILASHSITLRDQTGATWNPTVTAAAGQGRARFDVRQVKAGLYTYTATLLPGDAATAVNATVDPAPLAGVKLTASVSTLPADNASTSTLTAELVDVYGNRVTAGSYPVTFSKVTPATGATQGWVADQTTPSAGGLATATVTAARVIATETYRVSVPNANSPSQPFTATAAIATKGAAERLSLRYGDNNGDGTESGAGDNIGRAGIPLTVIVEVVDGFGGVVTYDSGRAITVTIRNMATGAETPVAVTTANGKAVATIPNNTTGRFAVKAESGTLIKALTVGYGGAVADTEFRPGLTAGLRVAADLAQLRTGLLTTWTNVTVTLLDANGNVTTNQTGMALSVTLQANPAGSGTFTTDDTALGAQLATRTVTIPTGASASAPVRFYSLAAPGATSITAATIDGTVSAPATVNTVGVSVLAGVQITPVDPAQYDPWTYADAAVSGQTVIVTATDAGGNRLADFFGNIALTAGSDAVVVAYFDPAVQTWRSVDQTLSNGRGDYPLTAAVAADRGQAMFRVRANSPGYKTYTATAGGFTATALGRFDGPSPDYITVQAAARKITGGGDQVAIEARVRDAAGNTLSYITGTVQFKLTVTSGSSQPGTPMTGSAQLQNGVATLTFQSANLLDQDTTLAIIAWAPDLKRTDGSNLTRGGSETNAATDSFVVDATPRITGVTFSNTGAAGTVNAGDTITITFSENINTATVGAVTGVRFDQATSTITFLGGNLGALNLNAGSIVNSNEYSASVSFPSGSSVTITLGAKAVPANPDTQASAVGSSASVVMTGAIRNDFGSGAKGTITIPISGNL